MIDLIQVYFSSRHQRGTHYSRKHREEHAKRSLVNGGPRVNGGPSVNGGPRPENSGGITSFLDNFMFPSQKIVKTEENNYGDIDDDNQVCYLSIN